MEQAERQERIVNLAADRLPGSPKPPMDIFKKLTRGIKFDSRQSSLVKPEAAKPEANVSVAAAALPRDLDFFAGAMTEPVEAPKTFASPSPPTKPQKQSKKKHRNGLFESQDDLNEFRQKHQIRLSLHQTSDSSVASESAAATTLHHVLDLKDPEQVLPVRCFEDLPTYYGFDERLLKHLQDVAAKDSEKEEKLVEGRRGLLLEDASSWRPTVVSAPTAVQMQAIPVFLKGRDMLVTAPTGSGKTLAFLLGLEGRLLQAASECAESENAVGAVVISPTRELADQIHSHFLKFTPRNDRGRPLLRVGHLTKSVVNSWQAQRPQSYPHVLVATPLRLIYAVRGGLLSLEQVKVLVLDEADRLFSDGFDEQLDELLVAMKTPARVQKVLFSATIPSGVESMARTILSAPYRITCGLLNPNGSTISAIQQQLVFCGNPAHSASSSSDKRFDEALGKFMALKQLISQGGMTPPALIFVNSATRAERLYRDLLNWSASASSLARVLPVDFLHAQRSQAERSSVLDAFRANRTWFLITTDVLARGLDFPPLSAVINYDFPDSTATYIHRIGRTGRAGRVGRAITLYTSADLPDLRIVVNVMKESGCSVPQWLQDHYSKSTGKGRLVRKLGYLKQQEEVVAEKVMEKEQVENPAAKKAKKTSLQ